MLWIPATIMMDPTGSPTLYSGGTNIGDFAAAGGLPAAFDGNTAQTPAVGARKTGNSTGYIGKNHGSSVYKMSSVNIYPCTAGADPAGFANSGTTVTLTFYGKNSAPASATDGTSLGSISGLAISTSSMQTINSSDTSTAYQYFWVAFTAGDGGGSYYCSEVQFYVL